MNVCTNKLIIDHMPLANKIAWKYKKIIPSFISFEEIQSIAYFGLVDAASRYRTEKGKFSSFAFIRITGEIKDFIKKNIKKSVEISIQDEEIEAKNSCDVENRDFIFFLTKSLNPIAKRIINLYYIENKSMKEIGVILNLSEGRVSQMHKQYLGQIKICYEKLVA